MHTANTCNGKAETNSFVLALGPPVLEDCVSDFSSFARWWRHEYYGSPVSLESFLKAIEEEGVECGAQVWDYFWYRNFGYLEYG